MDLFSSPFDFTAVDFLEPHEFTAMVEAVRITERALGVVSYASAQRESASRVFRRSLFVVQDVRAGEAFTAQNVRSIRPGHGLHTRHLEDVIGRVASTEVARGTPLSWDIIGSQLADHATSGEG